MVLFTDIGKDIDDAVALTYAIVTGIPLRTVVTTSKEAKNSANICQNIIDALSDHYPGAKKIKVYSGSIEPRKDYGKFHANIYKGDFSEGDFTFKQFDPRFIKGSSDAVVIGPLTDALASVRENKLKRILFMGQAFKDNSQVAADMKSYNFKCDPYASDALMQFQDKIPMAFIGKTIAYRVPLTKQDFEQIGIINHPVAKFLKEHAFTSFEFFKSNVPDLYEKIYKGTDNIAYCYDPLCMLAITDPQLFVFEEFGKHRIAVDILADQAKSNLFTRIKDGLSY